MRVLESHYLLYNGGTQNSLSTIQWEYLSLIAYCIKGVDITHRLLYKRGGHHSLPKLPPIIEAPPILETRLVLEALSEWLR